MEVPASWEGPAQAEGKKGYHYWSIKPGGYKAFKHGTSLHAVKLLYLAEFGITAELTQGRSACLLIGSDPFPQE